MDFPQDLTDEIVNLWDITEMDLVYQIPLLMQMESEFPADCQISLGNYGIEQIQNMGFQQFALEPAPSFFLAPFSGRDLTGQIVQVQDEDISIHFTNQQELESTQRLQKKDSSELVDIKKMTTTKGSKQNTTKNVDEDDDVIFVREYKAADIKKNQTAKINPINVIPKNNHSISTRGATYSKEDSVRRNPKRQARTSRSCQKLAKEHLLEGDFAFLDESDEEDLIVQKKSTNPATSPASASTSSTSSNENFKVWPINVHERPEYNPKTKHVEAFDYTIREIQKSYVKRKPRLETTFKSKPKKRYFIKRKPKEPKPVEKVSINEVEDCIRQTDKMLKDFCKELGENADKFEFLKKNQSVLISILDDFKEVKEDKN